MTKTKKAKERLLAADECMLGGKRVRIAKLTPKKWKEVVRAAERLPALIVQVASAPQEDLHSFIVAASELAMDEIVAVTAVLSGLDEEYLEESAGIDELFDYFVRVFEYNNLSKLAKNVQSLLSPILAKIDEQSTNG